jgi:hypothetical protein
VYLDGRLGVNMVVEREYRILKRNLETLIDLGPFLWFSPSSFIFSFFSFLFYHLLISI